MKGKTVWLHSLAMYPPYIAWHLYAEFHTDKYLSYAITLSKHHRTLPANIEYMVGLYTSATRIGVQTDKFPRKMCGIENIVCNANITRQVL